MMHEQLGTLYDRAFRRRQSLVSRGKMPHSDTQSHFGPVAGFDARKAAQIAAFFATNEGDHGIEKLKLIKLIYLAERQFLTDHGFPMLFDEFYSLPHGPICSSALNGIDQRIQADIWAPLIARHGHVIYPCKRTAREDMDEVSDAEMTALNQVWSCFGSYTSSRIRNWTHDHCPEYVEVGPGERLPIEYTDLLEAVGFTRAEAEEAAREVQTIRRAESLMSA